MSPDLEERLSDALKRLTPEPPHAYSSPARTTVPADIRSARRARWWPAVASAAAVLVVAGGVAWQQAARSGSGAPAGGTSATASAPRLCFGANLVAHSDPHASKSAITATVTLTNAGHHPCLFDPVPTLAVQLTGRAAIPLVQEGPREVTLTPGSALVYTVRIRRDGRCTTDDAQWRLLLPSRSRVDAASWLVPTHACRLLPGTSSVQVTP